MPERNFSEWYRTMQISYTIANIGTSVRGDVT